VLLFGVDDAGGVSGTMSGVCGAGLGSCSGEGPAGEGSLAGTSSIQMCVQVWMVTKVSLRRTTRRMVRI